MEWWPPEIWAGMRSGHGCPMCADAHLPVNPHSDLVRELEVSYVRLHKNQTHPGYTVVILKRHVCELHEVDRPTLAAFWSDVAKVGGVVAEMFHPVKVDNLVMGHRCPHLHAHVYPQYGDDDPFTLLDISAGSVRLSDAQQRDRVDAMRVALGS